MLENPQVILVTDKIQNFELLVKEIPLTNRMIVEVAGGDSIHGVYNYQKAIQSGIKYPAYSSPTSIEYAEKYNFPLIVMNAKALTEHPILLEKACALHSKGVTIMVYNTQFVDKKDFIFKYLGNTVSMIYTDKWYPNGASPVSEEEVDKFN